MKDDWNEDKPENYNGVFGSIKIKCNKRTKYKPKNWSKCKMKKETQEIMM